MVVEEVDFVHVEDAAVGGGQNARLEMTLTLANCFLNVERANYSIFGRADRQVDERCVALTDLELAVACASLADLTKTKCVFAVTGIGASIHRFNRRQQGRQTPGGGRFGRAAFAPDQDTADQRMDCIQDQRSLHALLADNRGEWIDDLHRGPFLSRVQAEDGMSHWKESADIEPTT